MDTVNEQSGDDRRYCDRCGALIVGEGAWGHDDNCYYLRAKAASRLAPDGHRA